jgi:hypothetical protein
VEWLTGSRSGEETGSELKPVFWNVDMRGDAGGYGMGSLTPCVFKVALNTPKHVREVAAPCPALPWKLSVRCPKGRQGTLIGTEAEVSP